MCCCWHFCWNAIIQSPSFQHETCFKSRLPSPCPPPATYPHIDAVNESACTLKALWQGNNEVQQCCFEYNQKWRWNVLTCSADEHRNMEESEMPSRLFSSCTSENLQLCLPSLSHTESVDSFPVTLPSRRDLCVFAHVSCEHKSAHIHSGQQFTHSLSDEPS